MSEVNPYAPPAEPANAEATSLPYQVDGPYLIVRSGTRLPMRCVLTNQPATSDDLVRRQIPGPSFRLVLAQNGCNLEYCINAGDRRRILFWARLVPIFCALVALAVSFVIGSGIVLLVALGVMQFLGRFVPRDPLRIKRRQSKRFWIAGISPNFLTDCIGDFHRNASNEIPD